jgi:exosome complex RNA-binding protein Csl4
MDKKKLVLPGDHLLSCEEAVPGENTYSENDEIYSASFGAENVNAGTVSVDRAGKSIVLPHVGMDVYCMVVKTSTNKAICTCMSVNEMDGKERSSNITAVLPVNAIRKGYVDHLRDEIKIGDIIKAKISKMSKMGIDISLIGPGLGIIYARPGARRKR